MKQKHRNDCVPTVMAMITGCKQEDFKDFIMKISGRDNKNGYTDWDALRFLIYKGYQMGIGFEFYGSQRLHKKNKIETFFLIKGRSAYVSVNSPTLRKEDGTPYAHAIYWDGERVHDPYPGRKDGLPLRCYEVTSWHPVKKIDDELANHLWVFNKNIGKLTDGRN